MSKKMTMFVAAVLLSLFTVSACFAADAAKWPEKPITMLIPFATGGGTDFNARLVAKILGDITGVRVNSINRTGGQGVIGHTAIAKSEPDGYTIGDIECELNMMHWSGLTSLTYRELTPLALIVSVGGAVFVDEKSPYQNINDLFKAMKAPGSRFKASGSPHGGIWHLCAAGMIQAEGIDMKNFQWVPNEGAAPSLQDLAAGGLDFVVCSPSEAAPLMSAKKVRALATVTKERLAEYPDIPTLKEATGSDWLLDSWSGIAAPGDLPKDLKDKIGDAIKKVWETDEFQNTMKKAGKTPAYLGPDDFEKFLAEMDVNYGKVMESVGLVKK
ncbi:MAG: tripartite tricarboxylate transporter substrate binding protein [Synergistaceae bacterium]|jgi:tripartite-type tricarboxylate transporter receptor subunit TctC|nr:tripartite tricarboxylate transporter substrate binding protein [Synergistaceae bacterium]